MKRTFEIQSKYDVTTQVCETGKECVRSAMDFMKEFKYGGFTHKDPSDFRLDQYINDGYKIEKVFFRHIGSLEGDIIVVFRNTRESIVREIAKKKEKYLEEEARLVALLSR